MENKRGDLFKRNQDLEELIVEINTLLGKIDKSTLQKTESPKFPILVILGVARSGTTLLMQWFANSGIFSYPTNFLSRFYGAPYIGAKLQQLLFDIKYNFNNELYDFSDKIEYSSNLGKTTGPLAPNEFWYFWRRFFKFGEIQILDKEMERNSDTGSFRAELASIQEVFNKPLVMKGNLVNWNIPFISKISDKILFIHIKRDPVHNMRSLLSSRVKYFNSEEPWYSFKPLEYEKLKNLSPIEQVAGQVYFTNKAISKGLESVDQSRWIEIDYEAFCADPKKLFDRIKIMLNNRGYNCNQQYDGLSKFKSGNIPELFGKKVDLFKKAYKKFYKYESK